MKAYLKILPYVGIVIGLLCLLLLLSMSPANACQLANGDIVWVKEETQKAIGANSLKMVKFHGYKALDHLKKSKLNLVDCGCDPANKAVEEAEDNLKKAVTARTMKASKDFMKLALQQTINTIDTLQNFESQPESGYGDDVLVMNTKEVLHQQGGVVLTPAKELQQKMDNSLTEFERSLEAVVLHVDCEDAFHFMNKVIHKSNRNLQQETLTDAQRHYNERVRQITLDALKRLEGCPTQ